MSLDRRLRHDGHEVVCAGREKADLAATGVIEKLIEDVQPDVVINAAAYTAVDRAEIERQQAHDINTVGAGRAAHAAAHLGLPIIHISTDYVFDGRKGAPYVETDAINPLGIYGQTKADGETEVVRANSRHVILRASWIYAAHGANFFLTMLRLAREKQHIGVVADQIGCPTSADDLADAISLIGARLTAADLDPSYYGVFHIAGAGSASWFDFAEAIMKEASARGLPSAIVQPLTTDQYPTAACRPRDTRLNCARLAATFEVKLPDWRESLGATFDKIKSE